MMVNIFPAADADAGLGAGKNITLEASAISWMDAGEYDAKAPPAAPAAVSDTDLLTAAKACRATAEKDRVVPCDDAMFGKHRGAAVHLQMGVAALGLVASTLY